VHCIWESAVATILHRSRFGSRFGQPEVTAELGLTVYVQGMVNHCQKFSDSCLNSVRRLLKGINPTDKILIQ